MEQLSYVGLYNSKHLFYSNYQSHLSFTLITDAQLNEEVYCYPLKAPIEIKAHVYLLNRIYFIAQLFNDSSPVIKAFVIDLPLKQGFDIQLNATELKEIANHWNANASFVYEENMLMLIGGINQSNKISSTVLSFDISLYSFTKQKYQEFSFYPRYRHGSTSYNGIIYVIGGFTQIPASDEAIAQDLQFVKYKGNGLGKFSTAKIEGEKPLLMIDPTVLIVNEKYVVAYSSYKYPKVWIMDTSNSIGKNYSFELDPIPRMIHLISCLLGEGDNKEIVSIAYATVCNDNDKKAIEIKSLMLK